MRDAIIRISLYGNITTKEPLVGCSRYNHFRILLTGPSPLLIVELKCLYSMYVSTYMLHEYVSDVRTYL